MGKGDRGDRPLSTGVAEEKGQRQRDGRWAESF